MTYIVEQMAGPHAVIPPLTRLVPTRFRPVVHPQSEIVFRRISTIDDLPPFDGDRYRGNPGMGLTNGYSRFSCVSPNGMLVFAYGSDDHCPALYSVITGNFLWWPEYTFPAPDIRTRRFGEKSNPRWDSNTSLILKSFYSDMDAPELWRLDMLTKAQSVIYDARAKNGLRNTDHCDQSRDGLLRGLRFGDGTSGIVNLQSSQLIRLFPNHSGEPDISPTGRWAVPSTGDPLKPLQFVSLFDSRPAFDAPVSAHSGWAWDRQGNEVFVSMDTTNDMFYAYDPNTKIRTDLFPLSAIGGDVNFHFASHPYPSNPGWILMSTYGGTGWAADQLMYVELVPNGRVWRLGGFNKWDFSPPSMNLDDRKAAQYFAECWASADSTGRYIYFGANYYARSNLELYRLELPDGWVSVIEGTNPEPPTPPTPPPPPTPTPNPHKKIKLPIPAHDIVVGAEELP